MEEFSALSAGQSHKGIAQEAISVAAEAEREHVVKLVRRFGGYTTDAILDPNIQIFCQPGINGFVGYRLDKRCLVVFGDPICAPQDKVGLSEAFHRYATQQGKDVVYVGASQEFSKGAIGRICHAAIEFGKEFIFDPTCDPRKMSGTQASLVRRKAKQAIKEGVTIHEYVQNDPVVQQAIENVGVLWLLKRRGLQLHISNVHLFEDCVGKRWFYAKQGDQVIGVVCLNQLDAHSGWLLNHLMLTPGAAKGTSEHLIVSVFETVAKEGCHHITVGAVTTQQLGEITGFSSFSIWLAQSIFKLARKIVFLDGLELFWGKFSPKKSQPIYVLFSRKRIGLSELMSLKKALSGSL